MYASISPSKLETFRKYLAQEYQGFITREKVVEAIRGETKWTPQANFGSGFHYLIEHGPEQFFDKTTGLYKVQDDQMPEPVFYTEREVQHVRVFKAAYPNMKFEAWHSLDLEVDGVPVKMPMRIDGLNGLEIHEQKTSGKPASVDFYERSLQWKIYLQATGANLVQYNTWYYCKPNKSDRDHTIEYMGFQFCPYEGMESDIRLHIQMYLDFVRRNGLEEFVFKTAAAKKATV